MSSSDELAKYLKPIVSWIGRKLEQKTLSSDERQNLIMLLELIKEQVPNENFSHTAR